MAATILAGRYAKALFELSLEMNLLDEIKEDMYTISRLCHESKDFRLFLKSPVIHAARKKAILKKMLEKHLNELSFRYVILITKKRREMYLEDIAAAFITLYKKFKDILTVTLKTAYNPDEDIRKKIIDLLHDQTGSNIELLDEVKKELIGGFILTYDNKQYDASISNQLEKLRRGAARINLYERKL
ncbi:MAG: ATP synthase F1 subunit delta [Bacteroidetes bacterium]|nr:ATP synthase F1 subunit delta [Bacteroidota bacterium]